MNEKEISTGGIESPFDNRDITTDQIGMALPDILPPSFENTDVVNWPVWHQRKIGACVGHTLAKAAQVYWFKKTGNVIYFSPRFLYAIAKCLDGYADEGTYPRLVAKILVEYGCATESTCPNDTTLSHEAYVYNRKLENIPQDAFKEALQYKVDGYAFVPLDAGSIKQAIFKTGAVSLLSRIGSEWWLPSWNNKDINPLRTPKNQIYGHEFLLTGWTTDGHKTVLNSWSDAWADRGFNKLPWNAYLPWINEAIVLTSIPKEVLDNAKNTKFIFTKDMKYGENSPDVKQLQKRLNLLPEYQTGYYGDITREAVIRFQDENKIPLTWAQRYIKRSSVVGPRTREVLNKK